MKGLEALTPSNVLLSKINSLIYWWNMSLLILSWTKEPFCLAFILWRTISGKPLFEVVLCGKFSPSKANFRQMSNVLLIRRHWQLFFKSIFSLVIFLKKEEKVEEMVRRPYHTYYAWLGLHNTLHNIIKHNDWFQTITKPKLKSHVIA